MDVMPRLVWPSWRGMTISGTPSRAISTAWAWKLVRRTPPHAGLARHVPQLGARGGGRPCPPAGRAVDDAEQRSDRQLDARLEPRRELFPGLVVHADLAAPAALAAADE